MSTFNEKAHKKRRTDFLYRKDRHHRSQGQELSELDVGKGIQTKINILYSKAKTLINNNTNAAISLLRQARKLNGRHDGINALLITAFIKMKKFTAAAQIVKCLKQTNPEYEIIHHFEKEKEIYLKTLIKRVRRCVGSDDPGQAFDLLLTMEELDTDGQFASAIFSMRVKALLKLGKTDQAEIVAQQFVDTYPTYEAYCRLSLVYLEQGKFVEARESANKALALAEVSGIEDDIKYTYSALARTYYFSGDLIMAKRLLLTANSQYYYYRNIITLAEIYRREKDYKKALLILSGVKPENESYPEHLCRAYCQMSLREFGLAFRSLETAEKIIGDDNDRYFYNPRLRLMGGYLFLYNQMMREEIAIFESLSKKVVEAARWICSLETRSLGIGQKSDYLSALGIAKKLIAC